MEEGPITEMLLKLDWLVGLDDMGLGFTVPALRTYLELNFQHNNVALKLSGQWTAVLLSIRTSP